MAKLKNKLKITVLLGIIVLVSFIVCSGKASASTKKEATSLNSESADIHIMAESVTGSAISADAASTAATLYPVRIKINDEYKAGYIDGTGKLVIQPIYQEAYDFSEGYAIVYNGKVYQVINLQGEVIYETENYIKEFHNGLAAFSDLKNNMWGYINTKGKVVIKSQYLLAGNFNKDNTAIVRTVSEKFCLINSKGKILKVYPLKIKDYYDSSFANGYIINDSSFANGYIITEDHKTYRKGIVDLYGKVILRPVYDDIICLGNGLFGVKKALPDDKVYLSEVQPSALFNKNGKKLTNYIYYDLTGFTGNYASATDSKYTFFIDINGKKVTSLPKLEGRGSMKLLGDVIQADIDNEQLYMKNDGTFIWKNDKTIHLESGITVNTRKFRPNKYVVVEYPMVEGMSNTNIQRAVNSTLKSIFTISRKGLKESDELSVCDTFTVSQIKDLLVIQRSGYDYLFGAAHGMPLRNYYFINVKTGDFYQLKDLFKADSDYITKLSKIIKKQIDKKKNSNDEDAGFYIGVFDKISEDQYFYIDKDNLTVYFDVYAITAYAAGFPEFKIPFKDIMSLINTNGAFWQAFH